MKDYYNKWNKYEIGNIHFVNNRKNHLSKIKYIDYVIKSNLDNIIEIGAGEVTEGQEIRKHSQGINYNVLDVSDTFLEYAKKLGFPITRSDMYNTPFEDKQFDLVYLCAVLEHSPDIHKTIKELSRIAKNFYFTMFKWKTKSGGLKSIYRTKNKYFSTEFNINKLIKLIEEYGSINGLFICTENNRTIKYNEYTKKLDTHRNGNYLSIIGEWL